MHFLLFLPLLYTTPQAFDSLMVGASDPGCKTEKTPSTHCATPDHQHTLLGKDAATADRLYLTMPQKRSMRILSKAWPFPTILTFTSLSISSLRTIWLVIWLPWSVGAARAVKNLSLTPPGQSLLQGFDPEIGQQGIAQPPTQNEPTIPPVRRSVQLRRIDREIRSPSGRMCIGRPHLIDSLNCNTM